jgi:hypothetical protein
MDEAVVWDRHVLSAVDPAYGEEEDNQAGGGEAAARPGAEAGAARAAASVAGAAGGSGGPHEAPAPNPWLAKWGLSEQVAREALNPGEPQDFATAQSVLRRA